MFFHLLGRVVISVHYKSISFLFFKKKVFLLKLIQTHHNNHNLILALKVYVFLFLVDLQIQKVDIKDLR